MKFILLCVMVLALSQSAWAQRAGAITQLTGTAQVLRAGVANNVPLTMPVELHDRLTTAADSILNLTLGFAPGSYRNAGGFGRLSIIKQWDFIE